MVFLVVLWVLLLRLPLLSLTDDGKIFHGSGVGDPFGPRCFEGDIMGCGIMFPRDYILDSEGERGGGACLIVTLAWCTYNDSHEAYMFAPVRFYP